ncbi:polyhydroxyalkanoate depolymerase [Burkholderia sp. GS2Y]|uniref:Polyhydroxyalkanoate depolymerase n=1 Tax=Burkholderia theae TaxID=3143496 RepID=A0ABU9WK56_9BURK
MLYHLHQIQRTMLDPYTAFTEAAARAIPGGRPHSLTRCVAASYELLHRIGKQYGKPDFGIRSVRVNDREVIISEQVVLDRSFCKLRRFKRFTDDAATLDRLKGEPVVLVCAPLSGHHATLLRDTVRALLADHKVYITDWVDARLVPPSAGEFTLSDYVRYIQEFIRHIGADTVHVVAVCQSTVPVLAAVSLMASAGEATPRSMTMMGGPIDARKSPTAVNSLAAAKSYAWFEDNVIHTVPSNYAGSGRKVYPGFLQHAGFVAMNPDRHFSSYYNYFLNLVKGDAEDADAHVRFYDEYNAVLDMAAEYYLQTIREVFQEFRLATGTWEIDGVAVCPHDIRSTALMTIEGELDDISGSGQTEAAHALCSGIPTTRKRHYTAPACGHYGIFSGRRWRETIYPSVRDFIRAHA